MSASIDGSKEAACGGCNFEQIVEDNGALAGTSKPRSAKKVPDFMKSFGWCTWDAFYSQVSAQGVLSALPNQRPSHGPS